MNKQEIRLLLEQTEDDNRPCEVDNSSTAEQEMSTALADFLTDQAYLGLEEGDYEYAERTFKRAIRVYEVAYIEFDDYCGTSGAIYNAYVGLSVCYELTERKQLALRMLLRAVDVIKDIRSHTFTDYYWYLEIDAYIRLGQMHHSVGNDEMALYYHEQAVQCLNDSNE